MASLGVKCEIPNPASSSRLSALRPVPSELDLLPNLAKSFRSERLRVLATLARFLFLGSFRTLLYKRTTNCAWSPNASLFHWDPRFES